MSPSNFGLQNCENLSYLSLANILREKGIRPYLLRCPEKFKPEVVSLFSVVGEQLRQRWTREFLSVRNRDDFALQFMPINSLIEDLKYIEVEIDKIPGKRISYFQNLISSFVDKGYVIREFSVYLRNYISEDLRYVELKEYCGIMHGARGKVFFNDCIPFTRVREFGFED